MKLDIRELDTIMYLLDSKTMEVNEKRAKRYLESDAKAHDEEDRELAEAAKEYQEIYKKVKQLRKDVHCGK